MTYHPFYVNVPPTFPYNAAGGEFYAPPAGPQMTYHQFRSMFLPYPPYAYSPAIFPPMAGQPYFAPLYPPQAPAAVPSPDYPVFPSSIPPVTDDIMRGYQPDPPDQQRSTSNRGTRNRNKFSEPYVRRSKDLVRPKSQEAKTAVHRPSSIELPEAATNPAINRKQESSKAPPTDQRQHYRQQAPATNLIKENIRYNPAALGSKKIITRQLFPPDILKEPVLDLNADFPPIASTKMPDATEQHATPIIPESAHSGMNYVSALINPRPRPVSPSPPLLQETSPPTAEPLNDSPIKKKKKKKKKKKTSPTADSEEQSKRKPVREFTFHDEEFPTLGLTSNSKSSPSERHFDWFSLQFESGDLGATPPPAVRHQSPVKQPSSQSKQQTTGKLPNHPSKHLSVSLIQFAVPSSAATVSKEQSAVSKDAATEATSSKPTIHQKAKHPARPHHGEDVTHSAANPLDSNAPRVLRGKEREVLKAKKPTPMKRVILRERAERRSQREAVAAVRQGAEGLQTAAQSGEGPGEISPTTEVSPSPLPQPVPEVINNPQQASATSRLHSRQFREYCNQMIGTQVTGCLTDMLTDLIRFQDRVHQKDPQKARIKRRLVYGIREVTKFLTIRKLKLVILAPDVERVVGKGGLDEAVTQVLTLCRSDGVPYVFGMTRRALGKVCNKPVPISIVGVFNYEGADAKVKRLFDLVEEGRKQYAEVRRMMLADAEPSSADGASQKGTPGTDVPIPRLAASGMGIGHSRNPSSAFSEPLSDLGFDSAPGGANEDQLEVLQEYLTVAMDPNQLTSAAEDPHWCDGLTTSADGQDAVEEGDNDQDFSESDGSSEDEEEEQEHDIGPGSDADLGVGAYDDLIAGRDEGCEEVETDASSGVVRTATTPETAAPLLSDSDSVAL